MDRITNFLLSLRGDIFKLLPMKESEIAGIDNHIDSYLESLIINVSGGLDTYPKLALEKQYLYVINNLQFLKSNDVSFKQWRRVILNSTKNIDNIYKLYGGE